MEIAVPHMPDDWSYQAHFVDIAPGLDYALGQPRDRYADVGRKPFGALAPVDHGPIGVVPRLPQTCALFWPGRPREWAPLELGGDFPEPFRLLGDRRFPAVKLKKRRRRHLQPQVRIGIARLHLQIVQQLDPRDRNAGLDGGDHGVASALD